VAETRETGTRGVIGALLERERRLVPRLEGVLRFRREIYREIGSDPHAIPQSLAVVIATAVLAALGQGSLVSIFAGLFGVIVVWMAATGLIWAVGRMAVGAPVDFSRLLRCSGFAYAWFALLLFSGLPILGPFFAWAAVLLSLASLVVATSEVLDTDSGRAVLICAVALGVPLLVLLWLGA
jgi:Yip1 domain